jgi:hypothetical protein
VSAHWKIVLDPHDRKKDGPEGLPLPHGLINYKDTNAKCRHLKKFTCKGILRQGLAESVPRLNKRLQIRALATGSLLPFSSVNATKVLNATKWMYLQSIKSVKHMSLSPLTGQFFKEKPTHRVRCLYSSFVHDYSIDGSVRAKTRALCAPVF